MNIQKVLEILFWILIVSGTVFYFTKSVKRMFQVAGGLAIFESWNYVFDYGLWPIVQGCFGGIGALVMIILAFINNFILLKWYRKCQVDWLGITVTDSVIKKSIEIRKSFDVSHGLKKLILALPTLVLFIAEKAITIRLIPFLVLSALQDSFVATAFYLHQENGNAKVELKAKDYFVFVLSTIYSCLIYTLFSEWVIIPAFKNVWQTFIQ